jgi:hypothetical protein
MSGRVECITCQRFALRGSSLARHGFGLCADNPPSRMVSAVHLRNCARHLPDKPERAEQLRVWMAKHEAQRKDV